MFKDWLKRHTFAPGQENIKHDPLTNPQHVILPPLHLKLGLMNNFVKAQNKEGQKFNYSN